MAEREPRIVAGRINITAFPRRGEGRWHIGGFMRAFAEREQLIQMLVEADRSDAIGAAVSFLLHAAEQEPDVVRAVLRARAERLGEPPREIIDVLARVAGKA